MFQTVYSDCDNPWTEENACLGVCAGVVTGYKGPPFQPEAPQIAVYRVQRGFNELGHLGAVVEMAVIPTGFKRSSFQLQWVSSIVEKGQTYAYSKYTRPPNVSEKMSAFRSDKLRTRAT